MSGRIDSSFRNTDMFDDMDRLFASMSDGFAFSLNGYPPVDVREEEKKYVLEAELPGYTENDVSVHIANGRLFICSREPDRFTRKQKGYLIRERRHSGFSRSFALPKDVARDRIRSRCRDGILILELPKYDTSRDGGNRQELR